MPWPKRRMTNRRLRLPRVRLLNAAGEPLPDGRAWIRLVRRVLAAEGFGGGEAHLILCRNDLIRDLNRRFRKLDRITDVLSFNYDDEEMPSEIYISLDKARFQAPRFGNDFSAEMRRLLVHGALHLCGHDHLNTRDRLAMRKLEDRYLAEEAGSTLKTGGKKA